MSTMKAEGLNKREAWIFIAGVVIGFLFGAYVNWFGGVN